MKFKRLIKIVFTIGERDFISEIEKGMSCSSAEFVNHTYTYTYYAFVSNGGMVYVCNPMYKVSECVSVHNRRVRLINFDYLKDITLHCNNSVLIRLIDESLLKMNVDLRYFDRYTRHNYKIYNAKSYVKTRGQWMEFSGILYNGETILFESDTQDIIARNGDQWNDESLDLNDVCDEEIC